MERPKLGEDEDDLLKFQREFLASQGAPSAAVVRKVDKRKSADKPARDVVSMDTLPAVAPEIEHPEPPKKTRFKASRDKDAASSLHHRDTGDLDPEEMIDKHDRGLAAVLTSIIERDTSHSVFCEPAKATQAFPTVLKQSAFAKTGGKGKSLFAQQIEEKGLADFGVMLQQEMTKMDTTPPHADSGVSSSRGQTASKVASKSHIVDGRGLSASGAEREAQSIHDENLTKMTEMTEEEILAEQQQLLEVLDPNIVAFLKSKAKSEGASATQLRPKPSKKNPKSAPQKKTETSELPMDVPVEGKGKWLHMDKIEYDKLEWMKDLPPPSAGDSQTGQQARFDFQGNLIPADANLPSNMGLHHHGDEPERAGYTVGELFQLARSTNIQQRVIALNTLANIITKAKNGSLDELIQTPILPSILDGGVIFLLRWACDDSVDSVMAAAVSAIRALLINLADEAALDLVSPWYQGCVVPALIPQATIQRLEQDRKEEDEENTEQETDADVAKRDLIQGLVTRMLLVERLQYILEIRQPQEPTVISILQILTRVARHSTQLAYELSRRKKLMDLIFSQFLPTNWESEGKTCLTNGRPVSAAMRLVCALCQAGRHIASTLLSTYTLDQILLRYLAFGTDQLQPSWMFGEVKLQLESLRAWNILLSYGLAVDIYVDMYEGVMVHLRSSLLPSLLKLSQSQQPNARDVGLVSALEAVLPVAAYRPAKTPFNTGETATPTQTTTVTSSASWSCVEGLLPLMKLATERSLAYLADNFTKQKPDLQFPTACLNFLATFYSKCEGQSSAGTVELLQQVEDFSAGSLQPFLKSWGFRSLFLQLFGASNILSESEEKRREVAACLPELGCDIRKSQNPVVCGSSPVGFLLALTRLVWTLCKVHKGVVSQTAEVLMRHDDVATYLKRVTSCPAHHLQNNHFTCFENLLQYYLIKLSSLLTSEPGLSIVHQLSLDVIGRLQEGDEYIAHDLMSTILFNPDFIPEGKEEELAAASMAEMKLSDSLILKSASQEEVNTSSSQLLREAVRSLPLIRAHYFKAFSHMEQQIAKSRCQYQQMPEEIDSLQTGGWESFLMPRDWVFLPLVELFNLSISAVLNKQTQFNISSFVPMVTSVVQWIFMLETWRKRALSSVSVALKISRLMCVFLAGDDRLFMEKSVYGYLACLFRCYTTPQMLEKMDFDEAVPGISSFYDLYTLFLDQYEGVSFGDPLFASYTLLPMQQCQNCMLRRAVWQEREKVLRSMPLPIPEMLLSMERFLSPDETDVQLIQLYGSSLLNGLVHQKRSPVLFVIAVHHLNHFLYFTQDAGGDTVRQRLWERVLRCKDGVLRDTIVQYKQANSEAANGLQLYDALPSNRQAVLNQHKQRLGL